MLYNSIYRIGTSIETEKLVLVREKREIKVQGFFWEMMNCAKIDCVEDCITS